MTKRMIDADALIKSIDNEKIRKFYLDYSIVSFDDIVSKINELATTAPATDVDDKNVVDIKFDIDKWKKYLNSNGHEGVLYKILFSNQKTLELIPNSSGGEYLDAFGDDNFNPLINDFHKNIFICLDLDIKDFLLSPQAYK